MKRKLIFITEALWIGGIESALVNLLNRIDYEKYDVTCLVLRGSLDLADRMPPECRLIVADRQHPVTFGEAYKYKRMYNLMEEPQHATKLRLFIWKALCAFLRAPEARLYAAYVKKQLGEEHFDTAIIYSDRVAETAVRAVNADKFLMFYHHGAMRREYHDTYGYKKAEKIIAVSELLAEKLKKYRPQYAEKIIAVNNLIDIERIKRMSAEEPETKFSKERFNIVSCGRLSEAKGMDIAASACGELVSAGFTNIRWWIVGGGPEEDALREQIAKLHLEEYVMLLGMRSNPYPYIRMADLYVQPSRFEAFGLTIKEAQVLGVPVLSTDTDGGKELICENENGMLCDTDASSIAGGIRVLIEHSELREKFKKALEHQDFDAANERIMQRLYSLF